jgi:predicted alpha/beta superfamily hydrolase
MQLQRATTGSNAGGVRSRASRGLSWLPGGKGSRMCVCGRVLLAVAAMVSPTGAVPAAQQPTVGQRVTLASEVLGHDLTLLVSLPPGYAGAEQRFPVLYLADGETAIVHARGTVDFLARQGTIPQLLVVGIADTGGATELAPSDIGAAGPVGRGNGSPAGGGGDAFLNFVARELFPYVDAHYRTVPFRIFSGRGFAGLLGTYALLTRPGLFNAVIAEDPPLTWEHGFIVKCAREFVSSHIEVKATYFITFDERDGQGRSAFDTLVHTLQGSHMADFRFGSLVLGEEQRGSTTPLSNYYGLRKIFEGWAMPAQAGKGGSPLSVADVRAHYAALSARLGFTVEPEERVVNQLGYQALQSGERGTALQLFRFNVSAHPGSANAHFSLGEALEADGQFDLALGNYRRAYEIATKDGNPNALIFKRHVEHLAGKPEESK